jgi:hypothetical protein
MQFNLDFLDCFLLLASNSEHLFGYKNGIDYESFSEMNNFSIQEKNGRVKYGKQCNNRGGLMMIYRDNL